MTIRTRGTHRYPRTIFTSFLPFKHIQTHCAHAQHFGCSNSDCPKHSIESSLLPLPHLSATGTTSWTSVTASLTHAFALIGGMYILQTKHRYEPNSQIDIAGKFVPMVDLTHYDEDTHSHVSDSPLHLPASANAPSSNSALVTFSQAEGDLMRNVRVSIRYRVGPW